MISLVFPGQGSQKVSMGSDLFDKFDYVKQLFKTADEILKYKISDLIMNGPQEKLNETRYDTPTLYSLNDGMEKYIVRNASSGKALKSIEYTPACFLSMTILDGEQ